MADSNGGQGRPQIRCPRCGETFEMPRPRTLKQETWWDRIFTWIVGRNGYVPTGQVITRCPWCEAAVKYTADAGAAERWERAELARLKTKYEEGNDDKENRL